MTKVTNMPLPAYMLQQPVITPIEALARRIRSRGVEMEISRKGSTVFIRNMDSTSSENAEGALRIVAEYADHNGLVVDAHVPSVLGHLDSAYLSNGFLVGFEAEEDEEQGSHHVMRRKPRR